eukprot:scaffold906_cov186-Alexandrium_tamarense.AAC.14
MSHEAFPNEFVTKRLPEPPARKSTNTNNPLLHLQHSPTSYLCQLPSQCMVLLLQRFKTSCPIDSQQAD